MGKYVHDWNCGSIWVHMENYRTMDDCGHMWTTMGKCGHMWTIKEKCGKGGPEPQSFNKSEIWDPYSW